MKIQEITLAKPTLEALANNKELPTRVAYKIYLMLSKVEASLSFFESKRLEIFQEYGETNDEGMMVIPPEKLAEATPKLEDLLQLDVEDPPEKVDISLDIDLGISPSDIQVLIPFINFVE